MKQRVFNKLSKQSGETIAETLVALLIASLALVMLAGAVSSAMNTVTRSKNTMDDYYTVNNALVVRSTAAPTKGGMTVNTTNGPYTGELTVSVTDLKHENTGIKVTYWKNEQISGTQVITYTKPKSALSPSPSPSI